MIKCMLVPLVLILLLLSSLLAVKLSSEDKDLVRWRLWALQAYGAAHILREILTIKSDDIEGRSKVYSALVKGEDLPDPTTPEAFNVFMKEIQGLGLDITLD